METKTISGQLTPQAPQIHVRTGIRSGDALEKCQDEVAGLKKHYQQLLTEARQQGIPV
jgi:hypothetical protein